ncbi:MAG: hypothetical protein H0T42_16005 [Deltaproteobacteria bacterium]|nr:hypothetical protein [Deltaproteobacteria bacterium]
MLYLIVAAGLVVLIGLHELVVRLARRTIRRPWAVLLGIPAGYFVLVGFALARYAGYGIETGPSEYIVDAALPGYDAAGKLESGDRILEADGVAVSPTGISLVSRVEASDGKPVVLTIQRGGERRDITVQPKQSQAGDRTVWLLGIKNHRGKDVVRDTSAALEAAALYPIRQTRDIALALRELIAGKEQVDVGGPIRIVEEFRRQPAGMRAALQLLLLFGVYAWLALAVFDLVRLVQLARQAPARSSAS